MSLTNIGFPNDFNTAIELTQVISQDYLGYQYLANATQYQANTSILFATYDAQMMINNVIITVYPINLLCMVRQVLQVRISMNKNKQSRMRLKLNIGF